MLATLLKPFGPDDLATVAGKLDQCRTDLAAVDAELRERSLELALLADDDAVPEGIAALQAKAAALKSRETLLEAALAEANRRERKRQADARAAAETSRLRALAQHRAAATKAAQQLGNGLKEAVQAWEKLLAATDRIEKCMQPDERRQMLGYFKMSGIVRNLAHLELHRLVAHASPSEPFPFVGKLTGYFDGLLSHGQFVGDLDDIAKQVSRRFDVAALYAPQPEPPTPADVDADAEQAAENQRQYLATYRAIRGEPISDPAAMPAASPAQGVQQAEPAGEPQPASEPNTPLPDSPSASDAVDSEVPAHVIAAQAVLKDPEASDDAKRAALATIGRPW